jgi:hypothetical protein
MYEIVKSTREQKQFEKTWEYFCDVYGWCNDPYAKNGIRYNLLLPGKRRKVIGTMEFIPYDPKNPNSTVERHFSFSKFADIKLQQNRVWEIDKLCLQKDYQRRGYFSNFMHVFYDHAKNHQPKYYIALIEKKFFRMLRIFFGLGVEQKGEEFDGPSTALIPVIFDVEKIMQEEETVRRLLITPSMYNEQIRNKFPLLTMNLSNTIFRRIFSR